MDTDPSQLQPLKIYRYRPEHDSSDSAWSGWKHLNLKDKRPRHMSTPKSLIIVTWNIDYHGHYVVERLHAALEYLQKDVFECLKDSDSPGPCCILLQEVQTRALREIRTNEWIRRHFIMTPIDNTKWPHSFENGNITLIEKSIFIHDAYILKYGMTDMARSAIIVDVRMLSRLGTQRRVRIINTQLEGNLDGGEFRRQQLKECAKLLKRSKSQQNLAPAQSGGLIAGDMNALDADADEVVRSFELVDSVAPLKDESEGHTWGYQGGMHCRKARLDKILTYTPDGKKRVRVADIRRIGIGLKWEGHWVSDHFGLIGTISVLA